MNVLVTLKKLIKPAKSSYALLAVTVAGLTSPCFADDGGGGPTIADLAGNVTDAH